MLVICPRLVLLHGTVENQTLVLQPNASAQRAIDFKASFLYSLIAKGTWIETQAINELFVVQNESQGGILDRVNDMASKGVGLNRHAGKETTGG